MTAALALVLPPALPGTVRGRLDAAVNAARASGVHVVLNVMTCCRSCTGYTDLGLPADAEGTPVAWHFSGQGRELAWDGDDRPVYLEEPRGCYCDELDYDDGECDTCRYGDDAERASQPADRLLFMFEPDTSVAGRLRDAFTAQGFDVEWDGSLAQGVTVRLA